MRLACASSACWHRPHPDLPRPARRRQPSPAHRRWRAMTRRSESRSMLPPALRPVSRRSIGRGGGAEARAERWRRAMRDSARVAARVNSASSVRPSAACARGGAVERILLVAATCVRGNRGNSNQTSRPLSFLRQPASCRLSYTPTRKDATTNASLRGVSPAAWLVSLFNALTAPTLRGAPRLSHQKNAAACHDFDAGVSQRLFFRSSTRVSVLLKTTVSGVIAPVRARSANSSRGRRTIASPSRYSTGL